jgi:hypothetical protein
MAAAAVDSGLAYPESPYDADDVPYPCKGCGEVELIFLFWCLGH